ncbi:MAG: MFS transporter [Coriobacteriales bacterium]
MSNSTKGKRTLSRAELPKGYENLMVTILCLAFGFVMFDRFALANLAGYWMPELGLDESALGLAMSVFAGTWAIVGFFGSRLADSKFSRKAILALAVLVFSVMSFLTGMIQGLFSLLLVRAIMGCAEGPVMPVSQSFIIPQSTPSRRGLNMGLMQVAAVGLISSLLGPIIQVALAESIGWRATFFVTIIPGIIIAFLCWKFLINPKTTTTAEEMAQVDAADDISDAVEIHPVETEEEKPSFFHALKNRNVLLSMLGTLFLLCWYVCMLTYAPTFLTSVAGFTPTDMSIIMAAFGVGAIVWGIVLPKISDVVGRKPVVIVAALMGSLSTFAFVWAVNSGMASVPLMVVIAFVAWGGTGVCALMQSTIPAESGDPRFVSSIIGANQLTGELIGATVGASVMGFLAVATSLDVVLIVLGCCMFVCVIVSLFYKESAPMVLARRAKQ